MSAPRFQASNLRLIRVIQLWPGAKIRLEAGGSVRAQPPHEAPTAVLVLVCAGNKRQTRMPCKSTTTRTRPVCSWNEALADGMAFSQGSTVPCKALFRSRFNQHIL